MNTINAKKRKITILGASRASISDTRTLIIDTLKCQDRDHDALFFDGALNLLSMVFPEDSKEFRIVSSDKRYWNWYTMEWCIASARFAKHVSKFHTVPLSAIRAMYENHMSFFCIGSKGIQESFRTFYKINHR